MKTIRKKHNKPFTCFLKLFSSIRSEKGQTLVEYSFLISLSAMMSSIVSFFQENLLIAFVIVAIVILLLFRKPKLVLVTVLIALFLIGILYLISILSSRY
jgi:hypothetical protein